MVTYRIYDNRSGQYLNYAMTFSDCYDENVWETSDKDVLFETIDELSSLYHIKPEWLSVYVIETFFIAATSARYHI